MGAQDEDPAPSEFLVACERDLPAGGRALDLACGRGRNAVWLAARGFDVVAVDVSTIGLAKARSLAERRSVAGRITTLAHDLAHGLPVFDAPFDVVLCLHFRRTELWPQLASLLAPRGLLLVETLARDAANLDVNPDFLSERDELLAAAQNLDVLLCARGTAGKRATDRLLARRPV
jgi:SAM-dependent methyltransferase